MQKSSVKVVRIAGEEPCWNEVGEPTAELLLQTWPVPDDEEFQFRPAWVTLGLGAEDAVFAVWVNDALEFEDGVGDQQCCEAEKTHLPICWLMSETLSSFRVNFYTNGHCPTFLVIVVPKQSEIERVLADIAADGQKASDLFDRFFLSGNEEFWIEGSTMVVSCYLRDLYTETATIFCCGQQERSVTVTFP